MSESYLEKQIDNTNRIRNIRRLKLEAQLIELCPLDPRRPDIFAKCCGPMCPAGDSCNAIIVYLQALGTHRPIHILDDAEWTPSGD